MTEDPTIAAFRDIVDRLRAGTGASRTTIRVDCAPLGMEMETVAVESLDHGARAVGATKRWR